VLAKRIIPCLDVKDGRVVKGVQFVALRDAGDPVEVAETYDAAGADEITFLDITASHERRNTLLDMVRATADRIFAPLTVGGGVKSERDVEALLDAGADKIAINTAAVSDPGLIERTAARWGTQAIVVAIDAKRTSTNDPPTWNVFTHGGRTDTGLDAIAWAKRVVELGAGEILLTSMDRDGTRSGYDLALTHAVTSAVVVPVIASGGVGTLEHIYEGLSAGGADGALCASIFHDGTFTVADAKNYLAKRGLTVRPAPRTLQPREMS